MSNDFQLLRQQAMMSMLFVDRLSSFLREALAVLAVRTQLVSASGTRPSLEQRHQRA
jgi:hypothetical protein